MGYASTDCALKKISCHALKNVPELLENIIHEMLFCGENVSFSAEFICCNI